MTGDGERVVFVFPGQGAQGPHMLDGVRGLPDFQAGYEFVCDLTRTNILAELERGNVELLRQNKFSSLLTVLVSALSLAQLRRQCAVQPCCVAGYSVGQWTALHAVGVLDFPMLARVVLERARFMDACVEREPSGMYAVVGLPLASVEQVLGELRADGHRAYVSNVNCLGNYSIAGTHEALELARGRFDDLGAKRLSTVPVSGAWHCPILEDAAHRFSRYLADVPLAPGTMPVMDNVTGDWLPGDVDQRRRLLAEHLSKPVLWEAGIRRCIAKCSRFVEIGYGKALTKLGFFIDRRAIFEPFDLSDPATISPALGGATSRLDGAG
jgi:[acyl-carrier-protein] S-malonyltransferase